MYFFPVLVGPVQPHQYLWTARRPVALQRAQPGSCWLRVIRPRCQKRPLQSLDPLIFFFFPTTCLCLPGWSQASLLIICLYQLCRFPPFHHLIPSLGILSSALVNNLPLLPSEPSLNSSSRQPPLINRIPAYWCPDYSKCDLWNKQVSIIHGLGGWGVGG